MNRRISVLLVDDHALVRRSVAQYLEKETDLSVVGEVASAHEALVEVERLAPDLVLMDVDMPGKNCFEAAKLIRARCPETRIVFLSAFFNDHYIDQALEVQALGYITKTESPEVVLKAIRTVMSGGVFYSPEVMARIVVESDGARLIQDAHSRISLLTSREVEVLRYIARGLAKKEIAAAMKISVNAVGNHSNFLMIKLGIHDRVKLARFAIREGLVEV